MTREEIREKIAKLLALASNNPSEEEAQVAAAKAQELAARYQIEIEVGEGDRECGWVEEIVRERLSTWRAQLLGSLARLNGAWTVKHSGRGVILTGERGSVEIVLALYRGVEAQVEALAKRRAKGLGKRFANAYRLGLVDSLRERMETGTRAAREGSEEGALVRLDQRTDLARERYLEAHGGRVRAARAMRVDSGGFEAGRRDGVLLRPHKEVGR